VVAGLGKKGGGSKRIAHLAGGEGLEVCRSGAAHWMRPTTGCTTSSSLATLLSASCPYQARTCRVCLQNTTTADRAGGCCPHGVRSMGLCEWRSQDQGSRPCNINQNKFERWAIASIYQPDFKGPPVSPKQGPG